MGFVMCSCWGCLGLKGVGTEFFWRSQGQLGLRWVASRKMTFHRYAFAGFHQIFATCVFTRMSTSLDWHVICYDSNGLSVRRRC